MDSWVEQRRRLLSLEHDEEILQLTQKLQHLTAQQCQNEGISLLSLTIDSSSISLFGRTTFILTKMDKSPFPPHSFRVGDEATLYSPRLQHTVSADVSTCQGVITKVSFKTIEMVTEAADGMELIYPLRLDLSASESTHRKLLKILDELQSIPDTPALPLIRIAFDNAPIKTPITCHFQPINNGLNESQVRLLGILLI
jgi:hypothetical protein